MDMLLKEESSYRREQITHRSVVALLLCCAAACTTASEPETAPTSTPQTQRAADFDEELAEMQEILDTTVQIDAAPGVVAWVRRGNQTEVLVSGVADTRHHVSIAPGDRFRIASITKPMVATVVLQLVDEGTLSLHDSVQKWLPALIPNGDQITVEQLLGHTSGLFNYTDDPAIVSMLRRGHNTPADLIQLATSHHPTFAPGHGLAYSNTNYVVLGLIIEKATGSSLEDNLDQRIFEPLGMASASAQPSESMNAPLARGYEDGKDVTSADLTWAWGAGFVVADAADTGRFLQALLGGELLDPALLTQMLPSHTGPLLGKSHYGLGLGRIDTYCYSAVGHNGEVPGFSSDAWMSADGDREIVVMWNTTVTQSLAGTVDALMYTALCSDA